MTALDSVYPKRLITGYTDHFGSMNIYNGKTLWHIHVVEFGYFGDFSTFK